MSLFERLIGRLRNSRPGRRWRHLRQRARRRRSAARSEAVPTTSRIVAALRALQGRGAPAPRSSASHPPTEASGPGVLAGAAIESPIFILATGWRTGSTLLQRICMTDPRVLVFGEPLGRASLVPRLTEALAAVSGDFPRPEWELGRVGDDLATTFPANLYPPLGSLREAMRSFLLEWLAAPALARGYERWGLKEVRLSAAEACLLHWLFPRARLLVLTRHPLAVFASSRDWNYWYRWPDTPVSGGLGVVRHWNRLAASWGDLPPGRDHRIVKYEELVSGNYDYRALEDYLGIEIEEEVALRKVTGSTRDKRAPTGRERRAILRATRDGLRVMGYEEGIGAGSTSAPREGGPSRRR